MYATGRATWQNPRVLTTLLLVFLSGAAVGAFSMQKWLHSSMHGPARRDTVARASTGLSYEDLKNQLQLSPKQADQLRVILDDSARYQDELLAQMEDWRATGKSQILRILDPQQRERFEHLFNESHVR